MGLFSHGPLSDAELKASRVEYIPAPPKPRRNTTRIIATRVCDGEQFEFMGWREIERLGFDRMAILACMIPKMGHNYEPSNRPYSGFRWEIVPPIDHPGANDTHLSPF